VKRGTPEHPKTKALARRLGVPWPMAVGTLELLWHFTARYAPAGDIGRFPDEAIAAAVGWPENRDPAELVRALCDCGWLDPHPEHRLMIHDWPDHCEDAVHVFLARRGLTFACGKPPKTSKLSKSERRAHNVPTECAPRTHPGCTSHSHSRSRSRKPEPMPAPLPEPEPQPKPEPAPEPGPVPQPLPAPLPEPAPVPLRPPQQTTPATRSHGSAGSALFVQNQQNGPPARWLQALEQAISRAVGRQPRPGAALKLARQAASMGVHPRYLLGWIQHRARASPPRSDGLFLKAIADLPDWVRRNHAYDSSWGLRESVVCPKCGEAIYAFRDVIVPCPCATEKGDSDDSS